MDGQEPGKHPTWIKADGPISAPASLEYGPRDSRVIAAVRSDWLALVHALAV